MKGFGSKLQQVNWHLIALRRLFPWRRPRTGRSASDYFHTVGGDRGLVISFYIFPLPLGVLDGFWTALPRTYLGCA